MWCHFTPSALIALEKRPSAENTKPADTFFFKRYQGSWELMNAPLRRPHLNNIEQALQEVVSSKQCIWKSWLFVVALSGHMFDLQLYRKACLDQTKHTAAFQEVEQLDFGWNNELKACGDNKVQSDNTTSESHGTFTPVWLNKHCVVPSKLCHEFI